MANRKGLLSGASVNKSKGTGSRIHVAVAVLLFAFIGFSVLFFARGAFAYGENENNGDPNSRGLNWREKQALEHLKPLLSKEVFDVINAGVEDLGPFSVDFFRKINLSASWKAVKQDPAAEKTTFYESSKIASNAKQETSGDKPLLLETPAKMARRRLREKRREKRAADLVKQDADVIVKLENAAIERSKSVDSAVLGKYSIWRKENDNENSDSTVRLIRDQMIMARVYISLAKMKNNFDLANELQARLKESQRSLGEASTDSDLQQR